MMEIKCNRRTFTVTEEDLILDNGACYQLITQEYNKDFDRYYPRVSKTLFRQLLRDGSIQLSGRKYKAFGGDEYDLYQFTERS